MIEYSGDLFSTQSKAVGHGVNIDGLMGAGIAVKFRTLFPEMYRHYRAICAWGHLNPGETYVYRSPNLTVYNIASQDRPGRHARLDWLEDGVAATLAHASATGLDSVALPRIGCGIGGLDWNDVRPLLLDLEAGTGVEIEVWTL